MTTQDKRATTPDWNSWLAQWNRELLKEVDLMRRDKVMPKGITPEVIASGWLGYPGATEEQIAQLEARLGKTLPPSYRAFLKASNGFRNPGELDSNLLSAREVDWFRTRNQETITMWKSNGLEDLSDTLAVSVFNDAVYLLNPKVVTSDGEWEAIYFSPGGASCDSYPSFWALMQQEYESLKLWVGDLDGHLRSDDDRQMIVVKYPSLIKDVELKMSSFDDINPPTEWSKGAKEALEAAKKRIIEIREKSSEPDVIRQQLKSLAQEFKKKWEDGVEARKKTGGYRDDRTEGLEHGYSVAKGSIEWFPNEPSPAQPEFVSWDILKARATASVPLTYSSNRNAIAYVTITVDKNGVVTKAENAEILKGGDKALGQATAQILKQWRFRPYEIGDQAAEIKSGVLVRVIDGKISLN